jgi:hypothetical protein
MGQMNTVSAMAERFGASEDQVKYIIKTRGVRPLGWVGHTRIFSDRQAVYIEQELKQIWMERNPAAEANRNAVGVERRHLLP